MFWLIGDSRIYKGVNPLFLVGDNSGMNAVNLGFSSAGYSDEYLSFVSGRIKEDDKSVVLCGITPYSFTPEALKNEHYHSFFDKDKKEVYKILFLSSYLEHFPRYSPAEIWDYFSEIPVTHLYHNSFKENGWVESYKIPFDSTSGLKSYRKTFVGNTCDTKAVQNYYDWVKEMSSNDLNYSWFSPSFNFGYGAARRFS